MRIFLDTEFIEDGRTIELLSIALVREDGPSVYFENGEADHSRANPFVREHVLPRLFGVGVPRAQIAAAVRAFVGEGEGIEFWAYYGAYDWVVLCQLFGAMSELPDNWPRFVHDFKQLLGKRRPIGRNAIASGLTSEHNALGDALWLRDAFREHSLYMHDKSPRAETS